MVTTTMTKSTMSKATKTSSKTKAVPKTATKSISKEPPS